MIEGKIKKNFRMDSVLFSREKKTVRDLYLREFISQNKKEKIVDLRKIRRERFYLEKKNPFLSVFRDLKKTTPAIPKISDSSFADRMVGGNFFPERNFSLEKAFCESWNKKAQAQGCSKNFFGKIKEKTEEEKEKILRKASCFFENISKGATLLRMWNVSIVSAVIFGMFLMTMIYRYLGQSAQAGTGKVVLYPENGAIEREIEKDDLPYVLGEVSETETQEENGEDYAKKIIFEHKQKVEKNQKKAELEKEIRKMVKGYPMEKMAPYIAEKDRTTAAFFVAMAKKESNWGKNVPVLAGQDCFNYLGYKGIRARMGSGGHTCFDSAQDAVNTISKRIDYLVKEENITTPEKMVTVWKCGYDCSWDDPAAVKKWVSDVKMYFDEFKR